MCAAIGTLTIGCLAVFVKNSTLCCDGWRITSFIPVLLIDPSSPEIRYGATFTCEFPVEESPDEHELIQA